MAFIKLLEYCYLIPWYHHGIFNFFLKGCCLSFFRLALAPDWGVCSCLEVRMSRVISSPGTRGLLFIVRLTLTQGCLSRPLATHPLKNRERMKDFNHLLSPCGSFTLVENDVSIEHFPRPGISSRRVNNVAHLFKVLLPNKFVHRKASFPDTD